MKPPRLWAGGESQREHAGPGRGASRGPPLGEFSIWDEGTLPPEQRGLPLGQQLDDQWPWGEDAHGYKMLGLPTGTGSLVPTEERSAQQLPGEVPTRP